MGEHVGEQFNCEDGGESHVQVVEDDLEESGGAILHDQAFGLLLRLDHRRAEIL